MIKDWLLRLPHQARVLLMGLLSLASLIMLLLAFSAGSAFFAAWARVDYAEPRIARLLGYEAVEEELAAAAAAARDALDQYAFTQGSDVSRQGAQLQQVLRAFAAEAGLSVIGSQFVLQTEMEGKVPEGFETLGVDLTLTGPPVALDTFLRDVADFEPALKVTALELQQPRRRRTSSGVELSEDINIKTQVMALMLGVD